MAIGQAARSSMPAVQLRVGRRGGVSGTAAIGLNPEGAWADAALPLPPRSFCRAVTIPPSHAATDVAATHGLTMITLRLIVEASSEVVGTHAGT